MPLVPNSARPSETAYLETPPSVLIFLCKIFMQEHKRYLKCAYIAIVHGSWGAQDLSLASCCMKTISCSFEIANPSNDVRGHVGPLNRPHSKHEADPHNLSTHGTNPGDFSRHWCCTRKKFPQPHPFTTVVSSRCRNFIIMIAQVKCLTMSLLAACLAEALLIQVENVEP